MKGIEINDKSNKGTKSKSNKLQKMCLSYRLKDKRKWISYLKPETNSNFDEIYILKL